MFGEFKNVKNRPPPLGGGVGLGLAQGLGGWLGGAGVEVAGLLVVFVVSSLSGFDVTTSAW